MSQGTPFPSSPQTTSAQVVLAGTTQIPGDSVAGVPSVVQSISALAGWEISESTGSAGAKVRIWDGTGTGAGNYPLTDVIDIGSGGQSVVEDVGAQVHNNALYIQVVSGSVHGELYWVP